MGSRKRTRPSWPPDAHATFLRLFGKAPRPPQVAFLEEVHQALEKSTSLLCEAPTGVGKTLCLLYACIVSQADAFEDSPCFYQKSILVAGGTKHLQTQYVATARKYMRHFGTLLVLFGRDNYPCLVRLKAQWDTFEESWMRSFFRSLLHRCNAGPGLQDVDFWSRSFLQDWLEVARRNGLAEEAALDAWSKVSARSSSECTCMRDAWRMVRTVPHSSFDEFTACPCALSRYFARSATLVIVNAPLVCQLASVGNWTTLSAGRFVAFDEAHVLPTCADAIYRSLEPPAFAKSSFARLQERWSAHPIASLLYADTTALDQVTNEHLAFRASREHEWKQTPALRHVNAFFQSIRLRYDPEALDRLRRWMGAIEDDVGQEVEEVFPLSFPLPDVLCGVPLATLVQELGTETMDALNSSSLSDATMALEALRACLVHTLALRRASVREELGAYERCVLESLASLVRDEGWKELRAMLDKVIGFFVALDLCVRASKGIDAWRAGDVATTAPAVSSDGVRFHLSSNERASAICRMLQFNQCPPVMTSATLRSHERDLTRRFSVFESLVGHTFARSLALASPFPPSSRRLVVPSKVRVPARWRHPDYVASFEQSRVEVLAAHVAANPRQLSLVIALRKQLLLEVAHALKHRFPEQTHLFVEDASALATVLKEGGRAIVYGSQSLAVGVDLPGRVGLVAILTSMSFPLSPLQEYERSYLGDEGVWRRYFLHQTQLFLQAMGRLVRQEGDHGTVLFFCKENTSSSPRPILELEAAERVYGSVVEWS